MPPNQLTVGVLAATHDMSKIAHVVATTPRPTVRRGAAEGRRSLRFPTMLITAATTATTITHHSASRGVGHGEEERAHAERRRPGRPAPSDRATAPTAA